MNEDRPRLAKEAERLRQLGLDFEEKLQPELFDFGPKETPAPPPGGATPPRPPMPPGH
jgi:hypothetical protein